jgi:glycosyltransferase involved in cell wall biosynthesis
MPMFDEALRAHIEDWLQGRGNFIRNQNASGDRIMKISHVCPFVDEQMGGSERYVCTLSKAQSKEHDVHIYTTTRYLDRVGTSKEEGVTIHRSYAPVTVWNINPLAYMLPALMKSESDVFHIHSHLYLTSNQAILAKLLKKRKSLLHLHGGVGMPPYQVSWPKLAAKRLYTSTLAKFTVENSDIVASVSRTDLEKIALSYSIPKMRLRYIPNVVDTDIFKPRENSNHDEKTILYVGDLEPWKGIGSLINWVKSINWANDHFTLRIVGQGSYLPFLLALHRKLQKKTSGFSLDILGARNHAEIPRILSDSSALILPSYWEGLPTVVLEAMASGVPVISTRVGDVPQIIEHRKTGFLMDRSPISFQESINSVFDEDSLIRRVISNARRLVEREFSLVRVKHITDGVYSEVFSQAM